MSGIIEAALQDPKLEIIIQTLQQAYAEEQVKRAQFRRDLTPSVKAEFILGEVVMHSPAKNRHIVATQNIFKLLSFYVEENDLGEIRVEKALIQADRNDFEPDLSFWRKARAANWQPNTEIFPYPDMVVEVLSPSTEGRDRGIKFDSYEQAGVNEYWLVDTERESVEQYVNTWENGIYKFAPVKMLKSGMTIECYELNGFSFPVAAVFDQGVCHQFVRELYRG